ncbi:MAG: TIGR00730 family Rossman fold protein [Lachnospiraceae bacterium]|nr:TIGR00730 family Rossman fold protein [Lachnospiraceae bacterium]
MKITVYLGSAHGRTPKYAEAVRELGTWIGAHGHDLVYGGSDVGLMGLLARSVLSAGGEVVGIEPQFLIDKVVQLPEITELISVETMSDRKKLLIEKGDAFIAFPGGTGTLEEISEIMSRTVMGLSEKPCIIYNLDHYYDHLEALLEHMMQEGLLIPDGKRRIRFLTSIEELEEILG